MTGFSCTQSSWLLSEIANTLMEEEDTLVLQIQEVCHHHKDECSVPPNQRVHVREARVMKQQIIRRETSLLSFEKKRRGPREGEKQPAYPSQETKEAMKGTEKNWPFRSSVWYRTNKTHTTKLVRAKVKLSPQPPTAFQFQEHDLS